MPKNIKLLFYVLAIALVLIVAVLLISKLNVSNQSEVKDSLKTIEGAQANSYLVDQDILETNNVDVTIGSQKAKLNILVFEDYANIYSAQTADTLEQIQNELSDAVSITIRPFVMPGSITSQESAMTYICAKDLGKGQEMRNKLWDYVQAEQKNNFNVISLAQDLSLNEEQFLACLTNQEKLIILENLKQTAEQTYILGAPTLIIGDEMIFGARPYNDFIDSNGDTIEGLKSIVNRKLKDLETVK